VTPPSLAASRALWNRTGLDLTSDEVLAQILDRGSVADWRILFELARDDASLRRRIHAIVLTVPLPLPRFLLAALAAAGEEIDWNVTLPEYTGGV
jgi:hypothetical protein